MNNPNFQQNGMAQRMGGSAGPQHFIQHYRQQLQQGKVPQGWQQSVPPEERGALGMQFFTQYRLLKPDVSEMEAMRASVNFETQTFMAAQTKDQYVNNIKQKLMMMTSARQAQMQQMQGGMGQPNNPMNGINAAQMNLMGPGGGMAGPRQGTPQQFNPAFPNAQLQRPMQISPVPNMSQGQQQMGMNAGTPLNLNQAQKPQQPGMQQAAQNRNDVVLINQFAKRLMETCKEEVRQKFQQDVQSWPEEKRQQLHSQGINPLFFRFRQHAEMMYKRGAINPQNLQQGGANGNANMNQLQQQNRMQAQRQPNQEFDFNAIANQQMEAMRVQDQGATVVPASNNMSNPQMNGFQGQTQQQPQQQNAMAQRQAEQAFQNNMHRQHAQQAQAQAQAAQAQAQQQAHVQLEQQRQRQAAQARNPNQLLQGLNGGGLNLPPGSNQSPGPMNMLNRPMLPPGQQMPPSTPQQQPQNHVPVMTPRPGQGQINDQQVSALMREAQQRANALGQSGQPLTEHARMSMMPGELGPEVKAQLLKVPEAQFRAILQNYRRSNGVQNVPFQGAQPGQQNMMFPNQQQMPPNMQNPMMGAANMAGLGRPGLNIGQQQAGPGQQAILGQRPPQMATQQQRLAHAQNLLRTSPGIISATENKPFPPNVLNNQVKNSLPPDVKTWHQLKQWASNNPAAMPGVDSQKLLLLQVLHFQDLISQQNKGQLGGPNPQQNNAGLAPPAPMNTNPGQVRPPQQQQQPNMANMAQIQVTPQDLQMYRQRLQGPQANIPDDQLRQLILQHKMKARQQQQQQAQQQQQLQQQAQQQQQQQQMLVQQAQRTAAQPVPPASGPQQPPARPTAQTQNSQLTPQAKAAPKPQPAAQTAQANTASKGTKRPNEDTNDSTSTANAAPQAPAMVPTKSSAGINNITQEQISKMTPQQQAQIRAQLLKAQDASNAANNKQQQPQQQQQQQRSLPNPQEIKTRMNDPARHRVFRQLIDEVEKSIPPRPFVQMPPELRAPLQQSLKEQMENFRKVEQALRIFHVTYEGSDSENVVRQVAKARALVFQQMDEKDGTLHDQLTLTAEEFKTHVRAMMNFVNKVMSKMRQQQSQTAAQQPQQQAPNVPTAQLNAANLKIVEQQQRQSKAPTAPTTDRPPFALGDQPVPGVPTYFQGAKTVTNLVLPDKKRTKLDPGSQTPTPGAKPSPRVGPGKSTSPELTRQQAPQVPQRPTFKCKSPECEYSVRGFDTQAELDSHVAQMHAKIENPMQFALEAMAEYTDVDMKTGEPKVDPNAVKPRAKPAPTNARVSQTIKSEHTPNVPPHAATPVAGQAAATPMTRVPTQQCIKSSPGASLLKTPQNMARVATPSSGAQAKGTPTSMPRPMPKEPQPMPPVEAIKEEEQQPLIPKSLLEYSYEDTFAALDANGPFTVLDLKDEDTTWALRSRPASPITTPDSSAKDTPSTRTSDISENDNLQINLDMEMPDAWAMSMAGNALPFDMQLSDDLQNLGVVLPPMDSDDMMLFPTYGDGMMDLETLEKTMDSMVSLDPSTFGTV